MSASKDEDLIYPDYKNSLFIKDPDWESTMFTHSLYDLNGSLSGTIGMACFEDGYYYQINSVSSKEEYASGQTDTLESAQFIVEMLSIKAGWKFE